MTIGNGVILSAAKNPLVQHSLPCILLPSQVYSHQRPLASLTCKNRFYRPRLTHHVTLSKSPVKRTITGATIDTTDTFDTTETATRWLIETSLPGLFILIHFKR